MQPIQLSLSPNPKISRLNLCGAFALIFSARELQGQDALVEVLAELFSQCIFQSGRTYSLPRGNGDISTGGLVWIANKGRQDINCPVGGIALQPLLCDQSGAVNVWIPQNSRLRPSIDAELLGRQLTLSSDLLIWLPSTGLVELERDNPIRPVDWLAAPVSTANVPWSSPPDVWSLPERLVEIGRLSPPSAQQLMEDVGREIGIPEWSLIDSDSTGEKADTPGALSRLQRWLLAKLDKFVGRADKGPAQTPDNEKVPGSAPLSGAGAGRAAAGIGMLGQGLTAVAGLVTAPLAAAMARMLRGQRDQQIQKLLNMLQTNPDQALKFAIPIGTVGAAFRGFAIPGTALLARLTDFSLGGLAKAGGPVDFWDINHQLQVKLRQKYREQANREIAAGRYRRAAYIYAHLLADFRGAAATLEQGKYFYEAAVLYRDKLNNKTDAARCLARAGQFQEASELYVSMNRFEEAGEIWLEAGNAEKAEQMFRHAYEQQIAKGAIVSAVTILDRRLDRRDDGLELLQRQWPAGADNVRCTEMAIRWLGEDGRHDDTKLFMSRIMQAAREDQMVDVAQIMRNAAGRYPDHQVRIAAEDLCRLSVSRGLNHGSSMQRSNLLSTLAILDKGDAQLRRDAIGYGRRRSEPAKRPAKRTGAALTLTQLKNLAFPDDARYVDYIVERGTLYALATKNSFGTEKDSIFVVSMPDLERPYQIASSVRSPLTANMMEISRADAFMVMVRGKSVLVYGPVAERHTHPSFHRDAPGLVLKPRNDVMTAVADGDRIWELCQSCDAIILRHRWGTYDLTESWAQALEEPGFGIDVEACRSFEICISGKTPVMALDRHLFVLQPGRIAHLANMGGTIRSIVSSMAHTFQRVAVAQANGLDVVFTQSGSTVHVCKERGYSLCEWVPNGRLLAVSDGCLHCFEHRYQNFAAAAEVNLPDRGNPVRLLRLSPDTIGVAYATGIIERYRLSR